MPAKSRMHIAGIAVTSAASKLKRKIRLMVTLRS
jgi:hypothetical protein